MYPKRLILDDARSLGIAVLPLDVNRSGTTYAVERLGAPATGAPATGDPATGDPAGGDRAGPGYRDLSDLGSLDNRDQVASADGMVDSYGIRVSLADVKGMSEIEMERIVERRPYSSLSDFWHRAGVTQPVTERLVLTGAFDSLHGISGTSHGGLGRRGRVTRRDLLLQVADLAAGTTRRIAKAAPTANRIAKAAPTAEPIAKAAPPTAIQMEQLTFDALTADAPPRPTGLRELGPADRVRAELEILGLDVSHHVVDFYAPMLDALAALRPPLVRSRDFLSLRSQAEILVAGVKAAVQTPLVRSGRRVILLTLDDATGPLDAAFFDDVQGPYASTVFGSWLLLVRGELRRTGPRGVSLRATGAWDLGEMHEEWSAGGIDAVAAMLEASPRPTPRGGRADEPHRVLVHASGFRQSPYADIKPAGTDPGKPAPSKLWHSSPGSSGW
jgi:error-prone DNA polymerase